MTKTYLAPIDDGRASHLVGRQLPKITLEATDGIHAHLPTYDKGRWILFIYPRTGVPGQEELDGWGEIPGAKGCTTEACSFRDNLAALTAAGVSRIAGLSVQTPEFQTEAVERLHLPYPLLSDTNYELTEALVLPTFEAAGVRVLNRLTMILDGRTITHTFYPVFPVEEHVSDVLLWLSENPVE